MTALEDVRVGSIVRGIVQGADVKIIARYAISSDRIRVLCEEVVSLRTTEAVLTRDREPSLALLRCVPPERPTSLGPCVANGTIQPPLPLQATYVDGHGTAHHIQARVLCDGAICMRGTRHATLVGAADHVLRLVDPMLPERDYRHRIPDGWDFWQYEHADGTLRYIRTLRGTLLHP